jgi:hypothetical protein
MKTLNILLLAVLGGLIISCEDDEPIQTNLALTEEEAVDIVESTLARQSAGLDESTYKFSKSYEEEYQVNSECNTMVQDDYDFDYNGNFVQADYAYTWDFTLTCNAFSVPQSASFNSSGSGSYSTPKLNSDDTMAFSANVTGLQPVASEFIYNGSYQRMGTQEYTSNFVNKYITSDYNSTISNITVSKSDYQITSGSADFTLTGYSNGTPFSFTGSVTFNGDNTATIIINGNQYIVDWN